jgi:hypothetical protein
MCGKAPEIPDTTGCKEMRYQPCRCHPYHKSQKIADIIVVNVFQEFSDNPVLHINEFSHAKLIPNFLKYQCS